MNITYRGGAAPITCQRALEFSEREQKLVRLAFDASASEGEILNSSIALVRSLRRRYRSGHEFLRDIARPPKPPPLPTVDEPFGYVVMTFGKHRGRRLRDIDPAYLLWVLDKCRNANPYLRRAIKRYLD